MSRENLALAYDMGGTKLLAGVISHQGEIVESLREPVAKAEGRLAVIEQMLNMGQALLKRHPEISRAGVASAGPLDPKEGLLLDPTNLTTGGAGWGIVPLVKELEQGLGMPVKLENDAAATAMAEHWIGDGKACDNFMVITLGTGVGVGVYVNGELLRSGRGLHPEVSHISLNIEDESAPCGCGKQGCVEAYLSGRNFSARVGSRLGNPELKGTELKAMARDGEPQVLAAFKDYARHFAFAVDAFVCMFSPEKVILTGGFSDTAEFFINDIRPHLEKSLARRRIGIDLYPEIKVSQLKYEMGLIGAGYTAFKNLN